MVQAEHCLARRRQNFARARQGAGGTFAPALPPRHPANEPSGAAANVAAQHSGKAALAQLCRLLLPCGAGDLLVPLLKLRPGDTRAGRPWRKAIHSPSPEVASVDVAQPSAFENRHLVHPR